MAQLILPVTEALELARKAGALPAELEAAHAEGDTITLYLNVRERLPRLLRTLSPTLTVALHFERYWAGRAAFRVEAALKALPLTTLAQLLLKLVALPELRGVAVTLEEGVLRLWVDLQALASERAPGLNITDVRVAEGRFFIEADLTTLMIPSKETR